LERLVGRPEAQVNAVATARGCRHFDLAAEREAEAVRYPLNRGLLVWVKRAATTTRTSAAVGGRVGTPGPFLKLPDRPACDDRLAGEPAAVAVIGREQECAAVALAQFAALDRGEG